MNTTPLICRRCKAPLDYEVGSAIHRCPYCGHTEKIDESDPVTIERIRADAYKAVEFRKSEVEKEVALEAKKLNIEEKKLGLKKTKFIAIIVLALVIVGSVVYGISEAQHKGKIRIDLSSGYYIGQDYNHVHELLEKAGFESIEDKPQETLTKKEEQELTIDFKFNLNSKL